MMSIFIVATAVSVLVISYISLTAYVKKIEKNQTSALRSVAEDANHNDRILNSNHHQLRGKLNKVMDLKDNHVVIKGNVTTTGNVATTGHISSAGNVSANQSLFSKNHVIMEADAKDKDIKALSLRRTDEDNRTHGWSFWHMNKAYGKNDMALWEYAADSKGVTCGGNVKDGAICEPAMIMRGHRGAMETGRNITTTGRMKAGQVQLGEKWVMSGNGDGHANDDWLRLMNKDGKNYHGGMAMGKLWVGGDAHFNGQEHHHGNVNIRGGSSEHNPHGWGTHFPWHGDNKNYIRGDTEMRGNTNNIGDLTVGRHLRVNDNAYIKRLDVKGGASEHNPGGGGGTHFPWHGDNKNYIRGDTEIRGNTNNIGDLKVGRNLNTGNTHVDGTLLVTKGNGDWNWVRVKGNHGDNLYLGSDGTNRGIWADGARDFTMYNNGIPGLSVQQNGNTSVKRNLNVTGDIVFDGTNGWIMHTPDDGRQTLYIANKKNGHWDWANQVRVEPDGRVHANQLCVGNTCMNESDFASAKALAATMKGRKIATGTTRTSDWKMYGGGPHFWVTVDLSAHKFKQPPQIFTSLSGSSHHWFTTGATSIYPNGTQGFNVYIRADMAGASLDMARQQNYMLHWMAIGDA